MMIHKLSVLSLTLFIPSIVQGEKTNLRKTLAATNETLYSNLDTYNGNITLDNSEIIEGYFLESNEGDSTDLENDEFARSLALLSDWSFCSTSSQCNNGCCTKKYSNDGRLKCTPLGIGFNPVSNECVSTSTNNGGSSGGGSSSGGNGDSNAWVQAHNVRRQKYHAMYGKSYVPVKWSASLANSAQAYANKLIRINGCVIQHNYQNDRFGGENLAAEMGWSDSADGVLKRWVENEDPRGGPYVFSKSGHFSQALWRGTKYIGCATANKSGCSIHACRYLAPGNCNIMGNEYRWSQLVFADSSPCGPKCPSEGCF